MPDALRVFLANGSALGIAAFFLAARFGIRIARLQMRVEALERERS